MLILESLALAIFALTALLVSHYDLQEMRIPDRVLLPGTMATALALLAHTLSTNNWQPLQQALLGATSSAAVYAILYATAKGGIGFGDVKFAALIGLVTGWHGLTVAVIAPVAAFVGATLAAAVLLASKTANRHTQIPLAPWMALGALAAFAFSGPNLSGTGNYSLGQFL